MSKIYDEVEIEIMHANDIDDFTLFDTTIEAAQEAACQRVNETWNEHAEENSETGGFPSDGILITASNLDDCDEEESSCGPFDMYYEGFDLRANWV